MTVKEVAAYLRMNYQTVYRMAQRGDIPAMKVGHSWRFRKEGIDHWLESQMVTASKRILVVDDDPLICELFADVLAHQGHAVTTALNGPTALEEIEKGHFDIIFLDIFMPEMKGVEVFKRIKRIDPQSKVVIITGYPDERLVQEAITEGPLVILRKPVSTEDIEGVLTLVGE